MADSETGVAHEEDYDPTWHAIDAALEALDEVRAVHLAEGELKNLHEARANLQDIQDKIDRLSSEEVED